MKIWLSLLLWILLLGTAQAATSFTVSPSTLTLTAAVGQANFTVPVTVTNTGTTALTMPNADGIQYFINTTPNSVSLPMGQALTMTITVSVANPLNCTGGCPMPAGVYTGTTFFTGGGITVSVPVTMTIGAPARPAKITGVTMTVQVFTTAALS